MKTYLGNITRKNETMAEFKRRARKTKKDLQWIWKLVGVVDKPIIGRKEAEFWLIPYC